MARVEIEVSTELAERLRQYQEELPDLLEQALAKLEHRRRGSREAQWPEPAEDAWRQQWQALAREVGQVWPDGTSALEILSAMRR